MREMDKWLAGSWPMVELQIGEGIYVYFYYLSRRTMWNTIRALDALIIRPEIPGLIALLV